ncbi:DEAD/DEAH box helicase family protein, partial [Rhodococcus sp. NPDC059968]|uniref:restriction endonuclease n=1 Tax=Rhodococcus sp. NPDC059968 TaxID=3347017 RepID=UPI00366EE834
MPTFTDLLASLAVDPRVRGRQFEHLCRWYLTNDPQYRGILRRVWLWDEWTGRWGPDAGIDLVAEDHVGRLWAIQAKAYGQQYAVTKADVDTFLAESSRAVFSYRLLIATTDKLSSTARRTIAAQEKAVGLVGLSDLLTADVEWPADPGQLRPSPTLEPVRPHDYQQEAIDAVVTGFDTADRGQLIMACGTGKTLTAQFISKELDAQRILVLVPSLSLLKQTMRVWQGQDRVEVLPVCSDETVSRGEDTPVEHVSELGLPVTTNPADIAEFLRTGSGPRVVFCTYQSSPQIAEAFTFGHVPAFDLVIADEAHRCTGQQSSTFATVLDSDR